MKIKNLLLAIIILVFAAFKAECQNLAAEADEQCKQFISKVFFNYNGDTYFGYVDDSYYGSNTVYQLNKFKTNLIAENISEIDILNGVEWKGSLTISATACRSINWFNHPSFNGLGFDQVLWKEWAAYADKKVYVLKKRGTWRVIGNEYPSIAVQIDLIRSLSAKGMENN